MVSAPLLDGLSGKYRIKLLENYSPISRPQKMLSRQGLGNSWQGKFKNLLMPLFSMGCFPVSFQEVKWPLTTKSGKRPIKVGKGPIKEEKRPIKAMVLVGNSVGCLMGCFRAPPPWRKTAPLKSPIIGNERRTQTFLFSNFSGTSGICRQNPGISSQNVVSRDIPNFSAPTPSRGRPPPHPKISGPKSLGLGSFSCLTLRGLWKMAAGNGAPPSRMLLDFPFRDYHSLLGFFHASFCRNMSGHEVTGWQVL